MFKSIRTRLTTAFLCLAILPILVVGSLLSYKSFTALKEAAVSHQNSEAARISIAVDDYIRGLEHILMLTSQAHKFMSLDRGEQEDVLEELLAYENRFQELSLIANNGMELIRVNRIDVVLGWLLVDRTSERSFQQAMELKKNYFTPIYFNQKSGEPLVDVAVPLQSVMNGKTQYVLLASIRLKKIWDLLADISSRNQIVFILDKAGNIIGHPDPSVVLSGQKYQLPPITSGIAEGLSGNQVVMAAKQLDFGNQSIYIVAQQEVTTALRLARSIVFISLMAVVISLIIAIVLSSLIIGNIIGPLQHLAVVARNIQDGDLDQEAESSRNDEVGELSRAFNNMTRKLRLSISSLEKEVEERKQAEKQTALSFERFRTVMDGIDALVYVADMETYELLFVNKYGREIWGEIAGRICYKSLQGAQDGPCAFCTNDQLMTADGEPADVLVWEFQNTVNLQWYQCRDQAIRWTDERFVRMEIAVDITRQKETEKALATEKERLAVTLRSIGDGVITTDTYGNIILLNTVAEQLTGWTQRDAAGKPLWKVFNTINETTRQPRENPAGKVMASGRIVGMESHTILIAKDGKEMSIADSGAPIRDRESKIIGVVLVFRDVTESLKMEAELFKIKKLESIGILAGGIAHDFNNILTAIIGNVNLALMDDKLTTRTQKLLSAAEKASARAKDLTLQLLTFSKGGAPVKKTASIGEVIRVSGGFILHGSNISCRYDIPEDLLFAEVDTGQISQVIQNLILNAAQAMPSGGTINVSCENITSLPENILPGRYGPYIKIRIEDHGVGIQEEAIENIFDPYFTTKEDGNGLGLAVVHSIISKHNGKIYVESKRGQGTTFTVFLPALSSGDLPAAAKGNVEKQPESARILVMDDDEMIREISEVMLVNLGHQVFLTTGGEETIKIYEKCRNDGNPIDIVIMDLTIPGGMGGRDAVARLLALDPDAKVMVSSGYSNDPIMANCQDYGFVASLIKPFTINELARIIQDVL